ncbi:hypothetical protein ACHWQZ_G004952 [Mnemiopsis leidyi]
MGEVWVTTKSRCPAGLHRTSATSVCAIRWAPGILVYPGASDEPAHVPPCMLPILDSIEENVPFTKYGKTHRELTLCGSRFNKKPKSWDIDSATDFKDKTDRSTAQLKSSLRDTASLRRDLDIRELQGWSWSFLGAIPRHSTSSGIHSAKRKLTAELGEDAHDAVVPCMNCQTLQNVPKERTKCQAAPRIVRYDYNPLKQNEESQGKYSVGVRNRFSLLLNQEPEEPYNPTAEYGKFMDAAMKQTKNYLSTSHEDEETTLLRICTNKESWALINDITGRKNKSSSLIDGGSAEGRLKNWQEHFKKLLGQPPVVPDEEMEVSTVHSPQDIRVDHFSKEELLEARKSIKEGKAFGEDGIAPEILKRVDLDDLILRFCNRALDDGSVPDQWRQLNIVPVPKKGNLTKVDNYRGIALTSIVSKTLNRMIHNRIRPAMENVLRINQNGFREGRSTTSHILCLRRILEGARDKNLSALFLFIDFKKAFDSVHRGVLMKILLAYGIPRNIVKVIEAMYKDTLARVITEDGLTEAFYILAGVMQGDNQWRNVAGLANMAPLGDENAPLIGAPGLRAYWDQFVKKWPKNLNK